MTSLLMSVALPQLLPQVPHRPLSSWVYWLGGHDDLGRVGTLITDSLVDTYGVPFDQPPPFSLLGCC